MYFHKKASSIIEAMIVLMIITSGVTGVYLLMSSSQKLANSTGNRIEAIQIARDGLEAMTNIRDTNWILYGADPANCWNTLNYSGSCVGDSTASTDITLLTNQAFRIYRDVNNRFLLSATGTTVYNNDYINDFKVSKDIRGFYTQMTGSGFTPLFTREIQVRYITPSGSTGTSNNDRMEVKAIVQWQDPGSSDIKKVEMDTLLTNWKK